MENNDKFLPVGSVVLLKGGKKELVIIGYCITPKGDVYDKNGKVDAKNQMFDYGACFYPEGMIKSDQLFAFNHDQIERVCFKGYETETSKEMSNLLKEGIRAMEEAGANQ